MKNTPKVSVVMPVYNGEKYLEESIESILNQTFKAFEFIIVNDGSSDRSEEIVRSYQNKDGRIHLITNPNNLGIAEATNVGIYHAHGEYIALMDQDDISMPERLEKEVNFLDLHPDISVVGANSIRLDEEGNQYTRRDLLETPGLIRWGLLFNNQIQNPTVMMRRKIFSEYGFRYIDFMPSQDYHMWLRLCDQFLIQNIQETFVIHRTHDKNASFILGGNYEPNIIKMKQDFVKNQFDKTITNDVARALSCPGKVKEIVSAVELCKIIIYWVNINLPILNKNEKNFIKNKSSRMLRDIWHSTSKNIAILPYIAYSIIL